MIPLGNINETHMVELVASPQMRKFGDDKRDTLTQQCAGMRCAHALHGPCPKDRFVESRDGEAGHNYLCKGLYHFFSHARPTMNIMGQLVQRRQPAARVMEWVAAEDAKRTAQRSLSLWQRSQIQAVPRQTSIEKPS